jgi:hypothetical protein
MATVWVANEGGHFYEPAKQIAGEDAQIKPLTIDNVNTLQVDRLARHLVRGIVNYVQPEDYLIFSGSPVINALALHLWISMHGECRTLNWDAKRREYKLKTLTKDHMAYLIQRQIELS